MTLVPILLGTFSSFAYIYIIQTSSLLLPFFTIRRFMTLQVQEIPAFSDPVLTYKLRFFLSQKIWNSFNPNGSDPYNNQATTGLVDFTSSNMMIGKRRQ